jgi:hypothetical protein
VRNKVMIMILLLLLLLRLIIIIIQLFIINSATKIIRPITETVQGNKKNKQIRKKIRKHIESDNKG